MIIRFVHSPYIMHSLSLGQTSSSDRGFFWLLRPFAAIFFYK